MDLQHARALVTGGSRGIGRAIASALRERGAGVAIMARDPERLEAAASALGAVAVPGDVSREEDARGAVKAAAEALGGLDILVNNAGIGSFGRLTEMDLEAHRRTLAVNLTGSLLMAREAVPVFRKQGSGNIVNISSTAGLRGFEGGTTYVASKFALKGMTECWRAELRRENIRVFLVNPSEVQTAFFDGEDPDPESINPRKLVAADVAHAVVGALEMDDRGFIPEFSVWATNPF